SGKKTAQATWGQPAAWCDYSGSSNDRPAGILLLAGPDNFRESWWHNRDYGLMVANPFGREAMKQGARSAVKVARGETLKLSFGAVIHGQRELDGAGEFEVFRQLATEKSAK
ncbi:MAG: PmoA family protein, partial [Planctomycetes bacterium]|nr:PmoA family protein [Planctomycetota bacterium]